MTKAKDPANPIQRGRNRPSHPRRAEALLLTKQVMYSRIHGFTFAAIAESMGKPLTTVKDAYKRGLVIARVDIEEAAESARAIELRRLDLYLEKLSPQVDKGDERAIDRALKIAERRAKLLGLDAPQKIAPTTPDGKESYKVQFTDVEKMARLTELLQRGHQRRLASESGGTKR